LFATSKGRGVGTKPFAPPQSSDAARRWKGVGKKSDFNTGEGGLKKLKKHMGITYTTQLYCLPHQRGEEPRQNLSPFPNL